MKFAQLLTTVCISACTLLLTHPASAQTLPALRQEMSYAQTRQLLIRSGWQAIAIPPLQREQPLSGIEQHIAEELGYAEVVACAGTGAGFCRFEFVAADRRRLVVITINNEPGQQPELYNWWTELAH